jgi:F0F1-type ATP synthase membrane subunit b/b'
MLNFTIDQIIIFHNISNMTSLPDTEVILQYVLNGLFSLIVFLFIVRPVFKTIVNSMSKISGEPSQASFNNKTNDNLNHAELEKKRKLEEIRKRNEEIHEQAKKEVEQMENEVVSKLFEGKPLK